jgi:hypothetical protein
VEISTGSVFELVSQACVAKRQTFLTTANFQKLYALAERQGRMSSGLRSSLLN